MKSTKISSDDIADAIINMSEQIGLCDSETAKGFKTSKKKEILESEKENSFSKFTNEIVKRQNKKD